MAVTLTEAKKNVQDDLQIGIIDEFRKSSFILDNIEFDDCISPTGGGATMTYSYTRLKTQPTAEFREVNTEYGNHEVEKERHSADLKIFGGAFKIDRVIANMGGIVSEVALQSEQKVKAAKALFNDTFINGDSAVNTKAFDGLDKALTGSDTEFILPAAIDLSTAAAIQANYVEFLHFLNKFLKKLDGKPSFIGGNADMVSAIQLCAQMAGRYQIVKNEFGEQVDSYNGIPLVDLGAKPGSNADVITTDGSGKSSLFFGRFGLDGLHAVSMAGVAPVQIWLPDYTTAGAVKSGEVEMTAAIVLKASKAAGKISNIKIA